ncbi:two-component sensor histidine kinase BarA [Thalassotalea sp. LPB0316]|uniref:two-component sensor histidine kinase BarA n=1 Tax=Thalassotalea sp. LPB0316 TaxID=2769490 RepID=UPI001867AA36|nr:two-component sensor histidine kinase BarA [Thalassotalea sp. LPB0316]QOL25570.1 two-component sensor histidine kinase BarA [Thalassotalea sp. LPB0316]
MQKISLKDWVILITILPTTLIGLGLAGYFTASRHAQLNDFLINKSTNIIEPIAIASTKLLENRQREDVRTLLSFTHKNHADIIRSIVLFTNDNQVFVTSAYNGDTNVMRVPAGYDLPQKTTVEEINDQLIFRTPIMVEVEPSESFSSSQQIIGYLSMQIDKKSIQFDQQREMIIAFLLVVLGSIISAVSSFRLIGKVTRPLGSMVQAVDRIREGKLESRVSGQLIGELNFLKNGINAMAQSLGDYHLEMQRSIDQATHDLRESLEQFEIQNVQLDIAKRKAQDANRVKSEFLANMSHELRTPLNGVIGFTRQVLKTPLSDTQRDYLHTIERSANNLLAIINDILDFSKLDAGKMVIENIPFALRESLEESIALLAPSAHKKNIELSLRINKDLPDSLIGDAMRIKQVLTNLVNNAIKFTDQGSVTIDVDTEHIDKDSVVVKVLVKDTGIGMSKQQQQTLFEAFNQADKSVTRLYGGTGLGLVISQRLVHEMHGDIGLQSEPDIGSTFWFTFKVDLNHIQLTTLSNETSLKDKSILYFEPHAHSRQAVAEILTSTQMKVTCVDDLSEFERLTEQQNFDYALIAGDVSPGSLNQLKSLVSQTSERIDNVHVAMNSTSPNLQEMIVAAGAKTCLSKPLVGLRLIKALQDKSSDNGHLPLRSNHVIVPIKVLAVDDNEANLKLIKALLSEQVQEVVTATNGEEALALCKQEKYAIIFMDIQMPKMDGITALKHIKDDTFNEKTPIVAVTAHALSDERDRLLKLGFNSYMTKPIDETMLKHTIYEYCDFKLFINAKKDPVETYTQTRVEVTEQPKPAVIDWSLALKRSANNEALAKDMLSGLVNSLPETQEKLTEAITCQDIDTTKSLIHKLNGACCYSGVPNLANCVNEIETQLKQGASIDDLEPNFFELSDHIEALTEQASQYVTPA